MNAPAAPFAQPIRRIGVVGHPRYAALHATIDRVRSFAETHDLELVFEPELVPAAEDVEVMHPARVDDLDLLVTLGGDGTQLRGSRLVAPHGVPVLGINLGHLGFLTSVGPSEMEQALEAAVRGDVSIDERMVLDARAVSADGTQRLGSIALNDAVLHRGGVARMIRLAIRVHGEEVGTYSADGIILATPTGSTAYSLSAGGPIVSPLVDCIVATPICPHTLAVRPLILSSAETVSVEVLSPNDQLILTIDGQESAKLAAGERLVVSRAPMPLRLVRLSGQTFFSTLRRKLRWGDLEGRER